jgi:hypothetical protein
MNIILPVAGKSSRFPNLRPKWLLTNPNGNLMIVDSILGMGLQNITSLNLIYLKEHEEKFSFKQGLLKNLKQYNLDTKINFIELETETAHQVETVRLGLEHIADDISFLIKDSDNSFKINVTSTEHNFVSYCKLDQLKSTDVASKSYLELDSMNVINNIVEKKVISDKFCCGAYFFKSSHEFLKFSNIQSSNLFVSDVVFNMLLNKETFVGIECTEYEDWGTLDAWKKYKNTFKTLFVDIDGTLFENSSAYVKPYIGETRPLINNINYLKELLATNRIQLILTTARPEEYRTITEQQLQSVGLSYTQLIMGLLHSTRIIINDFSESSPYKTCDAINIERNSDTLKKYLGNMV